MQLSAGCFSELVPLVGAHQGVIYQLDTGDAPDLTLLASYANDHEVGYPQRLKPGQSFIGQCAAEQRRILVTDIPPETVRVGSISLQALPRSLVVFPVIFEGQTKAVLLLASLREFGAAHLAFLEQLTQTLALC